MKKISLTILVGIMILTGCNKETPKKEETLKSKEVEINNETKFDFKEDTMNIYYEKNELIFYVDAVEYIENFEDMLIDDFEFEVDGDEIKMSIDDGYGSELILNFEDDTIYSSYMDVGANFFKTSESGEEFLEEYSTYFMNDEAIETNEVVKDYKSITYELTEYDLDMKIEGDNYYVPFHLMQFAMSEYSTKLIYNGDEFYYSEVFEEDTDISDYANNVAIDNELIEYNANFTKFIMDNYFGLKDIVDYEDEFDMVYKEYDEGKEQKYYDNYDSYFATLEDLHTSAYGNVYYEDFQISSDYLDFMLSSLDFYRLYCDFDAEKVTHKIISDTTAVVIVPDFSGERFATEYFEELEKVRGYENIILDLSCNLGGYLGNTHLFNYPFTNDKIYSYDGDINGAKVKNFATKKQDTELFNSNIYVLTSSTSFSAGNYAPIMFRDMGLGKTVGESSGGGTAAVALIVMPNGAVMSMSSGSSLLYDKNFKHVEDGVKIDIPIDLYKYDDLDEIYNAVAEAVK